MDNPLFEITATKKPGNAPGAVECAVNEFLDTLDTAQAGKSVHAAMIRTLAARIDAGGKGYEIAQMSSQLHDWVTDLAPTTDTVADLPDLGGLLKDLDR